MYDYLNYLNMIFNIYSIQYHTVFICVGPATSSNVFNVIVLKTGKARNIIKN